MLGVICLFKTDHSRDQMSRIVVLFDASMAIQFFRLNDVLCRLLRLRISDVLLINGQNEIFYKS